MSKSAKVSILFFIIFLAGVLEIISSVNHSLNKKSTADFHVNGISIVSPGQEDKLLK